MVAVTFEYFNRPSATIDIPVDTSLMSGAVQHMLDGIDAECGGAAACATCHVYIAEGWSARLPTPQPNEREMLQFVVEPSETSRLSCQVIMRDEFEGLVVKVPVSQK